MGQRPRIRPPVTAVRKWRRWLVPAGVVVVLAVVGVLSRNLFPEVVATLAGVRWPWVGLALLAQIASVLALAWQQAFLLRSVGGRVTWMSMAATTLAGDSISVGLPFAGPPAAAVFTYRRLHSAGNNAAVTSWALATSGVASTVALAVVIAVGAGLTGSVLGALVAAVASLAAVLPVIAVVAAMRHRAARESMQRGIDRGTRWLTRRIPVLPAARLGSFLHWLVQTYGELRLRPRRGLVVLAAALMNWLAAVSCLAASVVAVGGTVPWKELLIIWSAGTGAGYLGLTPGGVGIVEAALTAAFVASGSPAAVALGAVLVYRALTFWLVLLAGGVLLAAMPQTSHAEKRQASGDDARPQSPDDVRRP